MLLGAPGLELRPESIVKRRTPAQVLVRALDLVQGIVQAPVLVQALVPVQVPALRLLRMAEQQVVQVVIGRWFLPTRTDVGWMTRKIRNRLEMPRMYTGSERRVPRLKLTRSMPERPIRQPVDSISAVMEAERAPHASIRIQAVGTRPALMEVQR